LNDNDLRDYIGRDDLFVGVSGTFSTDRYSNTNAAIMTLNGFYRAPPDVYFSGTDVTLTLWFMWLTPTPNMGLMDCGNSGQKDNVLLYINTNNCLQSVICNANGCQRNGQFSYTIPVGVWLHIAFTISGGSVLTYYVNGVNFFATNTVPVSNAFRYACVFGTDMFDSAPNGFAKFDMIRTYNRSLSSAEIITDMNN
jgi:hypothetical protein